MAYSNKVKSDVLLVSETLIQEKGAVSKEVAIEMAKGVQRLTKSSIGLSLTGIAGPLGGTPEKPVGTYFACIVENERVHCWKGEARGSREMVIEWAVHDILASLIKIFENVDGL